MIVEQHNTTATAASFVLNFQQIDKTKLPLTGGKGANLGELCRIDGIRVPDGFCITTEAYKEIATGHPGLDSLLDKLACLKADDRRSVAEISLKIRAAIEQAPVPDHLVNMICSQLEQLGLNDAYAVRSSATAEDLPAASFAGQQDTYLNITGKHAIIKHISKCWASLFTDRAIVYRIQNGFDHRKIRLSVVVQKMIFPDVAGIMFTADPVTSNRKVLSIDAGFGLGEALVSGLVNADNYKIRDSVITDKKIPAKKIAIYAEPDGGTKEHTIDTETQNRQVLTDEQILELETIGRKIEEHFGCPQDIEWCMANDSFYIVQSRPITTLYPIPKVKDKENHVYLSVGHQQMMTDPMKPLGISFWQMIAVRPMFVAGGRSFVDVAQQLAPAASRAVLIEGMGQHDPLIKDALVTLVDRGDFIKLQPEEENANPGTPLVPHSEIENDPAIVAELISNDEASVAELKQSISTKSGLEVLDFIAEDIRQLRTFLFDPRSMSVIMAVINDSNWLNTKMNEWLGEKNVADTLSQSVSNNITSEMGLALLDVADIIRNYPEVVDYLQHVKSDNFLDELVRFKGGPETRAAIQTYLDKYGIRCAGEIDITNTRWREKPLILIPVILNNIKNLAPDEGARKFEQGRQKALQKEAELLRRLKQLPDGEQKAAQTKEKISRLRNFAGYREYPKYGKINRFFVYRQALMKEAAGLLRANVICEIEDIYYLDFEELREAVRTQSVDYRVINQRKQEFKTYKKLNPPRVMTSEGEIITGRYNREGFPDDAIMGLAVSSGIIEGRARVILKMEDAEIEEGDILVTPFTDPSWTPLFISIKGLITEVGGLMTHGAVIAREYGLPAVVGVENATTLIKDGQHIRLNGTDGYIELL
ncbi:phosphoenolpyruvate synthase [Mucilaginibacter sp. L3T2-6]|uniref:phosphoenolpyruvate synthase n=1 Tax=Mucilaginibacter sp. L3T2-6 TaxID=3062491 RepID=UPI00267560AC|nr:phosphoenolpyruvate synthase [Mucilaginibacter sp. L3T2-6]MDO3644202.1 phosphoenolpyruvate synthase [Mucilaginibacter sp. L3T2-6]MDV6216701.1 phosphoenolpyruvate synthase [Mucilaginibacter sp. L3T2-6]